MRLFLNIFLLIAMPFGAFAQKTITLTNIGADEIVKVWDNSSAPSSNHETMDEVVKKGRKFSHTSELQLYVYKADPDKANGQCAVYFPGGSYINVSFSFLAARLLKENGITVAIVKYRLPNSGYPEASLDDAVEAVRYMRRNAGHFNIDPTKVGVMGDSAGGHLSSWVSNRMPGEEPAFAVLFYPACIRTAWFVTQTAPINMLGRDITPAQSRALNTPEMVTSSTPPTLIFHSDDDTLVYPFSAIAYYTALKEHGVRSSMHIYPSGRHGWVGHSDFKYREDWQKALLDWLRIVNDNK